MTVNDNKNLAKAYVAIEYLSKMAKRYGTTRKKHKDLKKLLQDAACSIDDFRAVIRGENIDSSQENIDLREAINKEQARKRR